MANALARTLRVDGMENGNPVLVLTVAYTALPVTPDRPRGGGLDTQEVSVELLPEDQPAAIRSKMSAAVQADAAARGYPIVAGSITLPTFQKG